MSAILSKYKISLKKRIQTNPVTAVKETRAIIDSIDAEHYIIARFFSEYYKESDIQDYILTIIDEVKRNAIPEGETGSQSGIAVYITDSVTKFIDFHGAGSYLDPDLIIPTLYFREITLEWRSFLRNVK